VTVYPVAARVVVVSNRTGPCLAVRVNASTFRPGAWAAVVAVAVSLPVAGVLVEPLVLNGTMYCTFFPWAIQDVSAIVLAAAVASSRYALAAAAASSGSSSSAFSSGSGSSEIPGHTLDASASNAGEGSDSAAGEGSDSSAGDSGSGATTAATSTSTTVAAPITTSAAPASYANVTGVNASELVERAAAVLAANGGGAAMLVASDADAAAGEVSAASFGLVSLATAAAVQGVLVDVAAPAYVVEAATSPSSNSDSPTDDPVVPFWGWIIVGVGAAALVAAIIGAAVTRQRTAARVRAFSGFGGGGERSLDYNSNGGDNDGSGVAMSSYHKFDAPPSSDVDLTKRASHEADDEAMRARARFMPNSVQRESVRKHSTLDVEDEEDESHQRQQQPQIYGGSRGFPLAPGAPSSAPPLMMHEVQLTRTWTRAATIREEDI
jgi:hypothetical protein